MILPFVVDSHDIFVRVLHGLFTDMGALIRFRQDQWSHPEGYGYNRAVSDHDGTQQSANRVQIYMVCFTHCIFSEGSHDRIMHIGQVTKVGLSCYLVLLSFDRKTRYQDRRAFVTWPILYCQRSNSDGCGLNDDMNTSRNYHIIEK